MDRPGRHQRMQAIDRHIGGRIRMRRRCLGLTIKQLAARVGITYQQMYKNETGANHLPVERLYQLSRILGVSPDYFFVCLGDNIPSPRPSKEATFDELADHFIMLNEYDQRVVMGMARLFARGRATLAAPRQHQA